MVEREPVAHKYRRRNTGQASSAITIMAARVFSPSLRIIDPSVVLVDP